MVQHVERRLGLLSGLAVAVLLACAPASAKAPPTDAGTASGKDGGTAAAQATPEPEQKAEGATARSSGGGSCSGQATFCGVYSQVFCSSQPGCSYSFARNTCGGLPVKCETATNEAFCKKIKGCKWK
ncbi:hypothetical protein ACLESD_41880 [Pyxidicoccus sp. 3LFB2]